MRKHCSRCGLPCSSTWQSLNISIPVICHTCKSKEGNDKVVMDSNPINQLSTDEVGQKNHLLGSSSLTQITPSSSIVHENVAFSVSEIGMIFGNLTFEPTFAIPLIIRGKSSLELKVKSEVVTADDNQDHSGKNSKTLSISTVEDDSTYQIKQEYESEQDESEEGKNENEASWATKKVHKKKRSKLPQYTLSPLARFINQLQHAPPFHRRHPRRMRTAVVVGPKYDDVLIYQRCLYVAENEIGLGAELLVSPHSPPAVYGSRKSTALMIKGESSSTAADLHLM